jgi:hypothetical protein
MFTRTEQGSCRSAAMLLLKLIYRAQALPVHQRWVALTLYSAVNWIASDYLSLPALRMSNGKRVEPDFLSRDPKTNWAERAVVIATTAPTVYRAVSPAL